MILEGVEWRVKESSQGGSLLPKYKQPRNKTTNGGIRYNITTNMCLLPGSTKQTSPQEATVHSRMPGHDFCALFRLVFQSNYA